MLQFFAFCSCVAWNLLELLLLTGMLQFFVFCSCVAWNFLELLLLTGMLQFFVFCSCVAWNLLELLVLTGMLQFFPFCSCVAWNLLHLLIFNRNDAILFILQRSLFPRRHYGPFPHCQEPNNNIFWSRQCQLGAIGLRERLVEIS